VLGETENKPESKNKLLEDRLPTENRAEKKVLR
jgi:hypothetical protein